MGGARKVAQNNTCFVQGVIKRSGPLFINHRLTICEVQEARGTRPPSLPSNSLLMIPALTRQLNTERLQHVTDKPEGRLTL